MSEAELKTSDHWHMLSEDQQHQLLLEFREDDGWLTRELSFDTYSAPCNICGCNVPRGAKPMDGIWIHRARRHGTNLIVVCIDRPACHARAIIKSQEADNIAKDIARRVKV